MGNESISLMIIVLCIMMSAYFSATETAFNFFFIQWKKLLSMVFKASEDKGITEEELLTIVEEAGDIFTPRIDVEAVSVDADQEEIARVFADTGYSRLPVYEGNIDHVVGIVYQKDFHNRVYRTREMLGDIIKPAMFIARNKKIGALLKELQQNKMHITVEQMDEKRVKQVRIMVR